MGRGRGRGHSLPSERCVQRISLASVSSTTATVLPPRLSVFLMLLLERTIHLNRGKDLVVGDLNL